MRKGYLELDDALRLAGEADLLFHGNEYSVPADKILKLAVTSKCSAYDCEFAVLAEELGIKLVTSDQVILSAFPKLAVHSKRF